MLSDRELIAAYSKGHIGVGGLRAVEAAVRADMHREVQTELNPGVVLAALDRMLEPWTLHRNSELPTIRLRLAKLRAQVAEYVTPSTPNQTGTENA